MVSHILSSILHQTPFASPLSRLVSYCLRLRKLEMAQEGGIINEPFVIGEEKGSVRLSTLNRPRQLNVISPEVVLKLAEYLEMWEKDDQAKLILIKGAGRAFSAGGDLKMFYKGRDSKDSCLEVVYRMYWLCFHIHTYKKTQVSLVNGISMGGGASLMVPMKFSVVTEKTVFSTPEASIGFHTDCGFSYIHSRLPGYLGEFLALTGARLNGKELVAIGMATHFVPSDKLADLEAQLVTLDSGDVNVVRSTIEEFSEKVNLDKDSILNKQSVINVCFSKESVKQIIQAFEAEASKEGNEWITPVIKGLKRSSPTGLKITLRSIREGRNQTLSDCLKKEFRLTVNTLRKTISADMYEGIRALTIDKDNSPKWNPATLDEVDDENINLMFKPLEDDIELLIPETEENRWGGKYATSGYASLIQCKREEN
ncbi:PREDICTED: 3-hydroxyisobutyryl-CoA hydrolase-like protein 5 [Camelina sativa]|uniref:3-hydroxyisobutyryl-CoA hydrolase n=1 Tax=Camelina sativa TaxID=90675 RepID=A0ABM0VKZ0_CAMSA|nr:PREDICTED: 3-hydroxyisobutyryl-CoA hydrolase-like protein 5 [Camelina sativa]